MPKGKSWPRDSSSYKMTWFMDSGGKIPVTELHSTGSSMSAAQDSNRNRTEHDFPFVLMAGTGVAKRLSDIHTVRNYFFSFVVAGKERILLGSSSPLLSAVKKSLIHLFLCKTSSSVPNSGI